MSSLFGGGKKQRYDKIRKAGFVNVDQWDKMWFDANRQKKLLGLIKNDPSVTAVDLGWCGLGDADVAVLAQHLKGNKHVKELNLRENQITDEGCKALATMLLINNTLTWLSLFNNQITDEGCKALATALLTNNTLTTLRLNLNYSISDASASTLAEMLTVNSTLETLGLNWTSISATGKATLAAALGRRELDDLNIVRTPAELARALLTNMPWREDKHWRMNAEIRTNIFRALMVYEEHVEENVDLDGDGQFMPWDDFRHVIKAWSLWSVQRSLEAAIRKEQQVEVEVEDEEEEEEEDD